MTIPPSHSCAFLVLWLFGLTSPLPARVSSQNEKSQNPSSPATKVATPKQSAPAKQPSSDEELQQAIASSGNDRAALVRNLEAFLNKYPDSQQRPQIYRALVEASMQLRDQARAANYAERIVALSPDDISITVLTIQLLEHNGDEAALRRATTYATRVLEFVERSSSQEKSPKISPEEWTAEKKRDRMSVLALRGRLELKLNETLAAQTDFASSYAILPSATAAEHLGEIAELKKDLNGAIQQYARAFALADATNGPTGRHEIRQKLGNVWRLAHGSDDGLGELLLHTYDEVSQSATTKPRKNADAREVAEFQLRTAPDGAPFPLKDVKGKVLVLNFWATWCGPCHALEPLFARVAADFQANPDVLFLAADCDEDESLVAGYLEEDKPHTTVVFADGLDRFFTVSSFPTVMVIDRSGKIAYRSDGFEPDSFEPNLAAAVRRALAPPSAAAAAGNPAH
jgi:thiol-disulfide isomerase/thioredoxin